MRSSLVSVSALAFLALEASGRIVPTAGKELSERDQTYRASNGEKFAVEYGFDYHGGDYKEITTENLHDCINYCAAHSSCRAASYTGKSCWLKSTVEAAVANSRVTGAVRLQYVPSPITCPMDGSDQLVQADGKKYTVECGTDRPHGDIGSVPTLDFPNCIKLCDETSGCIAASWRFGDCYLKKSLKPAISNSWVDTAVLSSLLNAPALCPSQNGKQITETSGRSFTVACNTDRPRGDMASKPLANFNDCISWCDETSGCIAAAYRDGHCWLKNQLMPSSQPATYVNPHHVDYNKIDFEDGTSTSASVSDSSAQTAAQTTQTASISTPPGTLQTPTGPITLDAQPTATLGPLPPPNVNLAGTDAVTPQAISNLWFGSSSAASNASGAVNSPTVRVNITFEYPSIVLDNSINVINIQCSSGSLSADFNSTQVYNAAKAAWTAAEGNATSLIVITAASGCSSDGNYVYFVASNFAFNDKTHSVSCSGSIESVADIAQEVGMDFGSIQYSAPASGSNSDPEANYGCTAPGSSQVDGLPAIYCGPDFDQRLDDKLGYYSGSDEDFNATLAALAPGVPANSPERRGLIERRCFLGLCHVVQAVEHVVSTVYHAVATVVTSVAHNIVNNVESAADKLASEAEQTIGNLASDVLSFVENLASAVVGLATFLVTGDYSNSFDFPLHLGPPPLSLDESPWGDGFKFYDWTPDKGEWYDAQADAIDKMKSVVLGDADPEPGIELWCVNCGVQGDLKVTGSISYSLANGLTKGQVSMNGNIYAGLFLGMNAFAEWDPTYEYDFLTLGLPGFEIPHIIIVGPSLSLGVSIDLDISAVGQYLAGAGLTWPALSATLDFVHHGDSSQSGWTPIVNDTVQADGSLTVNSTLGLPITLGFGIDVLDGKYKKEIKLVDTPGVRGSLEYDFTNELTNGSFNSAPADGCYGIEWSIGLVNTVVLDLSDIDQGTYTLDEWDGPLFASGCIGESLTIAAPTTTVTAQPGGSTSVAPPQTYPDCSTFTCPNNDSGYCTSNGETFQLNCEVDYETPQLANLCVTSLADCVNACSSTYSSSCIGVSFFSWGIQDCIEQENNPWEQDEFDYANCFPFSVASGAVSGEQANSGWSLLKASPPTRKRSHFDLHGRVPTLTTSAFTTGTSTSTVGTSTSTAGTTSTSTTHTSTTGTSHAATTTATSSTDTASAALPSPTDNFRSITINDATGQLQINPHVNGSLFISAANSSVSLTNLTNGIGFVADTSESAVMGDSIGRLLYYFPNTISAVGASRLRLGAWGSIPNGAELVTLFPTKSSTGVTVLVAVDSSLNVFYPFVCSIEGQLNKIFLVADADTGSSTLMNSDLTYTVIGGVAQQCLSLAMVAEGLTGWSPPSTTSPPARI
ncbi:hypothetical protein TASIC1_0017001200 [Trichoderma asperellum]|uniref:Apple domain-containing protein n=1 Tax=Trichoderma asperellum TaxID=101201 RepID=A0A6V8R6K5_TRIAP|nr:hypothetical protein TASIC1_0017001200 [Trichoderma asperellum]